MVKKKKKHFVSTKQKFIKNRRKFKKTGCQTITQPYAITNVFIFLIFIFIFFFIDELPKIILIMRTSAQRSQVINKK